MPARKEMPSTLKRSDKHAQEVWAETHDSAVESYGALYPRHSQRNASGSRDAPCFAVWPPSPNSKR